MALNIPPSLQQRFASVIHELQDIVGPDSTKAYLSFLAHSNESDPESLVKSYRKEHCSDEQCTPDKDCETGEEPWMAYLNEDCMTDDANTLDPMAPSATFLARDPTTEPFLIKTSSLTDSTKAKISTSVDVGAFGSSSAIESMDPILCERCAGERCKQQATRSTKGKEDDSFIGGIIQGLTRRNLLDFFATYWETLKTDGLYTDSSVQVLGWTLESNTAHVHRLHHHLILRHLRIEDDLHQWRRSIAEIKNLEGYQAFFAEANHQRISGKNVRQSGENNSNKAHKEYLAHIFTDRVPQDFEKAKLALKKDLQFGRRWSILIDGFPDGDNSITLGLGLGVILLCGPSMKSKMSVIQLWDKQRANR